MIHQDANKIYIYPKVERQPKSDFTYRKDWTTNTYWITHRGNDFEHCENIEAVQDRLKELREAEWQE